MERGEAWHWTLHVKDHPDQIIGVVSLMTGDGNNRGFWIARPWQRRGFASEAAQAVTDYWFGRAEVPRIAGAEGCGERSRRVGSAFVIAL